MQATIRCMVASLGVKVLRSAGVDVGIALES